MSRYYDLSQNAVLFGDQMLPMDAFMTTRNTEEMNLVTQIFDFAKSLAEMQLSEMVLALYSAYILLQEGKMRSFAKNNMTGLNVIFESTERPGLRNVGDIKRLSEAVLNQLQRELIQRPPRVPVKGDVSILNKLLNKRHALG